jgi:hypothetical protein
MTTKKHAFYGILAMVSLLGLSITQSARATLITFDDLGGGPIPNGYQGLNWSNFYVLNTSGFTPSGYVNGTISSPNVAFNAFGNPASFAGSSPFTLTSAYLTAAWNDGLNVEVIGLLGVNTVYDNTYVLNTQTPMHINFNYVGIDTVEFIAFGGINHGYGGSGTHFAMDNLVINGNGVPDAGSTFVLLGLAVCSIGLVHRRTRAATFRHS